MFEGYLVSCPVVENKLLCQALCALLCRGKNISCLVGAKSFPASYHVGSADENHSV